MFQLAATLAEGDRTFLQATLALLSAFTFGIVVQGRLVERSSDSAMPPDVHRRLALLELAAVPFVLVVSMAGALICAFYLVRDEPIVGGDRDALYAALGVIAVYALVHSFGRRALPLLWRNRSDQLGAEMDPAVPIVALGGLVLALTFALPALYGVAENRSFVPLAVIAAAGAIVGAGLLMARVSDGTSRDTRRRHDKLLNRGYRPCRVRVRDNDQLLDGWCNDHRPSIVLLEDRAARRAAELLDGDAAAPTLHIATFRRHTELRLRPQGTVQTRIRVERGELGLLALPRGDVFTLVEPESQPDAGAQGVVEPATNGRA